MKVGQLKYFRRPFYDEIIDFDEVIYLIYSVSLRLIDTFFVIFIYSKSMGIPLV